MLDVSGMTMKARRVAFGDIVVNFSPKQVGVVTRQNPLACGRAQRENNFMKELFIEQSWRETKHEATRTARAFSLRRSKLECEIWLAVTWFASMFTQA